MPLPFVHQTVARFLERNKPVDGRFAPFDDDYRRESVAVLLSSGLALDDALDTVALHVAREFEAGRMTFEEADAVANDLQCVAWGKDPDPESGAVILPTRTWEVFCAFDAGEYTRPKGPPDLDPIAAYTRPEIRSLLGRYGAA